MHGKETSAYPLWIGVNMFEKNIRHYQKFSYVKTHDAKILIKGIRI